MPQECDDLAHRFYSFWQDLKDAACIKKKMKNKNVVSIIMSASFLLPINYVLGEIEKLQLMQSYFLLLFCCEVTNN